MNDLFLSYEKLIENQSLFFTYFALFIGYCAYYHYTNKPIGGTDNQSIDQSKLSLPKAWFSPFHAFLVFVLICLLSCWSINQYEKSEGFLIENGVKLINQGIPDDAQSINQSINQLPNLIGTIPFDAETVDACVNDPICLLDAPDGSGKYTAIRTAIAGKAGAAFSLKINQSINQSINHHHGLWCRFAESVGIYGQSNDKSHRLIRAAFERAMMDQSIKGSIGSLANQSFLPSFHVLIDDLENATTFELRMLLSWAMLWSKKGGHFIFLSNGPVQSRLKQLGDLSKIVNHRVFQSINVNVLKRHLSTNHTRAIAQWMPMKDQSINQLIDICGTHPACIARVLVPMHQSIDQSSNQSINQSINHSIIQSINQSMYQWDDDLFQSFLKSAQKSYVDEIEHCLMHPTEDFTVFHPEGYTDQSIMIELGIPLIDLLIDRLIDVEINQSIIFGVVLEGVHERLIKSDLADHWSMKQLRDGLTDVINQLLDCQILSFHDQSISWTHTGVARAAPQALKQVRAKAAQLKKTEKLHSEL